MGKYDCGNITPSRCVPYTGGTLTFLTDQTDLPCNASQDDVTKLMDKALTTLLTGNDLTGLKVRCLNFVPTTVTPKELHQLEIDEICAAKSRLITLETTLASLDIGNQLIHLDLGCLAPAAASCMVSDNTYSLLAILSTIKSEICLMKQKLDTL